MINIKDGSQKPKPGNKYQSRATNIRYKQQQISNLGNKYQSGATKIKAGQQYKSRTTRNIKAGQQNPKPGNKYQSRATISKAGQQTSKPVYMQRVFALHRNEYEGNPCNLTFDLGGASDMIPV